MPDTPLPNRGPTRGSALPRAESDANTAAATPPPPPPPPAPPDPPAAAGAHSPQHDGRVGHHLGDVPLVRVYQMLLATS